MRILAAGATRAVGRRLLPLLASAAITFRARPARESR